MTYVVILALAVWVLLQQRRNDRLTRRVDALAARTRALAEEREPLLLDTPLPAMAANDDVARPAIGNVLPWMETALKCLERFGERLRQMRAESVRVVGTNTLRRARRKGAFLDRARLALGHPIEIISGIEEARLIYLGVAHTVPTEPGRRLVVDIGGGSTVLIIGEGLQARKLESLYIGCVSTSTRYFGDGSISEKRMRRARIAARLEIEPVRAAFRNLGWEQAVGSSGTIRCVSEILRARGPGEGLITPEAVESLIEHTVRAGDDARLRLPGLSEERVPVFAGGLAILAEVLSAFEIKSLRAAEGALREGLLYDLVGRLTDEDARVRSVRAMQGRYHDDLAQAERVCLLKNKITK